MPETIQPSDNPIATALVIAHSLIETSGKHLQGGNNSSATDVAKEINTVTHALLQGWTVSGLHGSKS